MQCSIEDQIPADHLLRLIDQHIDLSFVRERVKSLYSATGRPSIDPEILLRLLLVGYLYGITSERRLLEEVRMHLAYRWFTRLDFEQEVPDHSTFSKNRHGRFRQSGVFREVFEEIVRRCLEAGLVEGKNLAVDGTMVGANASRQSRVQREQLQEAAQVSQTVQEYLAELEQANPVVDTEMVSTTDPDAVWATKGGPAMMAYFDNYLIDTSSRVILGVEATPALFHQETVAARRMVERVQKLGVRPESVGADKAYGSGEFLAWLLARGVQPHIPVIDRRHQTDGCFTREQFRYDPAENAYYCPEGKALRYRGLQRKNQGYAYEAKPAQCQGCPQKKLCTPAPARRLFVHWHEPARHPLLQLRRTAIFPGRYVQSLDDSLKRICAENGWPERFWLCKTAIPAPPHNAPQNFPFSKSIPNPQPYTPTSLWKVIRTSFSDAGVEVVVWSDASTMGLRFLLVEPACRSSFEVWLYSLEATPAIPRVSPIESVSESRSSFSEDVRHERGPMSPTSYEGQNVVELKYRDH